MNEEKKEKWIGSLIGQGPGFAYSVWSKENLCPTLTTMGGGGRQPFITNKEEELMKILKAKGCALRGRGDDNMQTLEENGTECANALTTVQKDSMVALSELRIRKLTPKECWRLQGRTDEEFEKAAKVNSSAQLYKQAGNSITVDVLENIFRELFRQYPYEINPK